ncbi:Resolvase, N terminal domain [Natronincola peptidivorans]|uniref:Resolvase, N terminal domain n=1 Tax=Natronincola peptidivorans TaxID=426128 RepID=A0A1I0F111_9FIRM|nr:recombinase family protein [Natronincola peptidivorans]SET51669.1 Resolvase, N terminal domain [Natronincola peptidivorans]
MECKKKGVAYVRYSSDNQRDESIDAQIRAIKDYGQRNEIEIVKVYADKAKTATSDKRPGFQQMVKDSATGIFEMVLVHKLDRFSRSKYDSSFYKRKLKKMEYEW